MTDRQLKVYWRMWSRVARANHWRDVRGELHSAAVSEFASELHARVWQAAEARAAQGARAVASEDLRHGCHTVACGRDRSSSEIGNGAEATRVFAVFRLLIDPDDIQARMDLEDREQDARRRLVWRIRQAAPAAYILEICRSQFSGKFEAPHWETLPTACLHSLVRTLSARTDRWKDPLWKNTAEHAEHAEHAE